MIMAVDVEHEWRDIVIGADLDAVRFAHKNKYFLIKNRLPHYHSYEPAEQEWASKVYQLHNMGLSPLTDALTYIKILTEEKIVKVSMNSVTYKIKYENLYVFDDENVEGAELDRQLEFYRVIDWFDCQGLCGNHKSILTNDIFIKKILFFKSPRIDGNKKYMDLLCESHLSKNQLKKFDYSDTMARLKTEKILKDNGILKVKMKFWKRDIYPVYK